LLALTLLGFVLGGVSFYFLRAEPVYGLIAAVLAIGQSFASGVLLGSRRAVGAGLVEGVRTLALGRSAVRLVFQHVLGAVEVTRPGQLEVPSSEPVPLGRAEQGIQAAVKSLIAASEGSAFRRRMREFLLRLVGKYSLARVREAGAAGGSVDLQALQADLESRVDNFLIQKVRGSTSRLTLIVIVGLILMVALQTWIMVWLRGLV
jgi:hypothetical protein